MQRRLAPQRADSLPVGRMEYLIAIFRGTRSATMARMAILGTECGTLAMVETRHTSLFKLTGTQTFSDGWL